MKTPTETVRLQYWTGKTWVSAGKPFFSEWSAWTSLGNDNLNYRTIDSHGKVLTDKRVSTPPTDQQGGKR